MLYKHVLLSAFIPVYMQYILYVQFDWGWCCLCLSSCLDIVEGGTAAAAPPPSGLATLSSVGAVP